MQHHCRRQSEVSRASFIYHRHRRDPHTAEYVTESSYSCMTTTADVRDLYVKTIIIRSHSGSNSDYDEEEEEEEKDEDDSPILRDPVHLDIAGNK